MLVPFRNEPPTDFSQPAERAAFEAALQQAADRFDEEYPLLIGSEPVYSGEWIDSYNPCQRDQRVGRVARATPRLAERALDAAWATYPDW